MTNVSYQESPQWRWNWTSLCGEGGFKIWSPGTHDLGLCFQQLCLQIPALALLACISAFYIGNSGRFVGRTPLEINCIRIRGLVTLILSLLPVLQVIIDLTNGDGTIAKISYFLCAVQGISWFMHFLFIVVLKRKLGVSPRGPIYVSVLWSLIFVINVLSFRSHLLIYSQLFKPGYSIYLSFVFSICSLVFQCIYALTLLPGKAGVTHLEYFEIDENQPLLQSGYVRFREEVDQGYLGVAVEDEPWLSRLLFYWVNPLMVKGTEEKLQQSEDLFDLPTSLNVRTVSCKFEERLLQKFEKINQSSRSLKDCAAGSSSNFTPTSDTNNDLSVKFQKSSKTKKVSLLRALHSCFWKEFYSIGLLRLCGDCAGFGGPLLLNKLVTFIENKDEDYKWGFIFALGLTLTSLISAFCNAHFNFCMAMVSLKMRIALVTSIYSKTLSVSGNVLESTFSVGEIVNFMSTDTDRIVNSCPSFHSFWSIPFQLGVTLYLLYSLVGISFLAGVAFSVVLIPINKLIASKIGVLSGKLMEVKDARIKVITEVIRGIKAIKAYVWEQHFTRIISKLRERELKYLKGRKYLDALCVYFWATTPVLISILTFGTYVLLGNKLTAATVFTGIALLNMLISPLNAFPWVLNGLTEAWISIKRVQRLLDLPDLDLNTFYESTLIDENPNCDIVIDKAAFRWSKTLSDEDKKKLHNIVEKKSLKNKGKGKGSNPLQENNEIEKDPNRIFSLSDINLKIKKGEFIGVIGSVGCGKSSILSAILAELDMNEGNIAVSSIETGFGFVGQNPWLQRGSIRDNILFGKPFDESKYKSVLFACGLVEDLNTLPSGDLTGVGESGMTLSGGQRARVALARAVYQDKSVYLFDDVLSAVDVNVAKHIFQHCIMSLLKHKTRILCTHLVQYLIHADRIVLMENGTITHHGKPAEVLSNVDDHLPLDLELAESAESSAVSSLLNSIQAEATNKEETDSVLQGETSRFGNVEARIYFTYWKAIGHILSICILVSITMMQTSRNMSDWWLSNWVTNSNSDNTTNSTFYVMLEANGYSNWKYNHDINYYLKIYVEFAVLNSVFTLMRAFLFAYGGIVAAAKIHKLLMKSVIKGKSTFFDISPAGRILNRFSSDTYTVDDSLPFILNILLAQFFGLVGTIVITVYGLPWICLILVPLIPVYHYLQNNYRLTSRELKRISSVTLSPVYSHFTETLQGLSTVRAMRATRRFKRENEDYIESNVKAQLASQAASCWLGLRLQFIGVAMVAGVAFIAVVQHRYDVADPGLIGLAMSYALSVTGALSGVISAFTETEREMIAVERVHQYITEIPPETNHFTLDAPFGWPSHGVITFNDVTLRYREHLAPSLKNISFESRPLEKIGVVGRTGAGKSSLVSALFRLVECTSGSISIDNVNISQISLASLRSRLFWIPQEPFLFSGTLRDNLDPLGEFRDSEIWSALEKVSLSEIVRSLGGEGLCTEVDSAGRNFSAGQKQLICLARAILHNAKVLCIDEATANVDQETDRQIQLTLRSAFRNSTVITIAHRLETIQDSDRIIVMSDGQIVEFDTPENLAFCPDSRIQKIFSAES